jgi:hypothetical protein
MDVRRSFIISSSPNLANIMSKCPLTFSRWCVSIVALLQHPHKLYPFTNVIYICYTNSMAFDFVDIFVPSTDRVITLWPPRLIHGVCHLRGFLFFLFAAPCPVSGLFWLNPAPALPSLFAPCVHCTMASGSTIGILELKWIYLDTRFDLNT